MSPPNSARGFTLLEALLASLLVATAVIGLAHLVVRAAEQSLATRRATTALTLAQGKLEQLRALPWRFNIDGTRISSPLLSLSPADSLVAETGEYVELLDRFGALTRDVAAAHYHRRWAVAAVHEDADTLVLQVCTFAVADGGRPDACVWGIRTRKP